MNTKQCLICKTEFVTSYLQAKVCSKECKLAFRRSKKDKVIKSCLICNSDFYAIGNLKLCSSMCKEKHIKEYNFKLRTSKKCSVCNNVFLAVGKSLTCSKKCSKQSINIRVNNRYYNDINFKLCDILRSRLNKALKNNQKSGSAVNDLGCSIEELKQHLESQFKPGMTWDNHSLDGWHIDHTKALANFDLSNRAELLKACHYTNLKPMWANENQSKGSK